MARSPCSSIENAPKKQSQKCANPIAGRFTSQAELGLSLRLTERAFFVTSRQSIFCPAGERMHQKVHTTYSVSMCLSLKRSASGRRRHESCSVLVDAKETRTSTASCLLDCEALAVRELRSMKRCMSPFPSC